MWRQAQALGLHASHTLPPTPSCLGLHLNFVLGLHVHAHLSAAASSSTRPTTLNWYLNWYQPGPHPPHPTHRQAAAHPDAMWAAQQQQQLLRHHPVPPQVPTPVHPPDHHSGTAAGRGCCAGQEGECVARCAGAAAQGGAAGEGLGGCELSYVAFHVHFSGLFMWAVCGCRRALMVGRDGGLGSWRRIGDRMVPYG